VAKDLIDVDALRKQQRPASPVTGARSEPDQFQKEAGEGCAVLDKIGSLPFANEGRSSLVGAMVCVHLKQLERARSPLTDFRGMS
jgi:hypothetical protein